MVQNLTTVLKNVIVDISSFHLPVQCETGSPGDMGPRGDFGTPGIQGPIGKQSLKLKPADYFCSISLAKAYLSL